MKPWHSIKLWWRALRPISFPASAVPALLGVALAWQAGVAIRVDLAVMTLFGAVAVHAAVNLLQDYFDFKNGIDRAGTLGGSGVLVEGSLTPRDILVASIYFFAISAVAALPLVARAGMPLILIIAGGFVAGAGYAVPGKGFKYRALGDAAVFLAFGIGITLGSYFIQARSISWSAVLCAFSFGLLVDGILHANNMRDAEDDLKVGLRTLVSIIGTKGSRIFFASLIAGAYVIPLVAVAARALPPGVLLTLITLPLAIPLLRDVWRAQPSDRPVMALAVDRTAKLSLAFGIAMMAGVVSTRLLKDLI
ncbi:MAG: 1,4-dihydroxy-2-naphthoate octaprenyltransferase [bacterium]